MANLLCISHEWNLGFEELRELSNAGFRVFPTPSGYEAVKQFASRDIDAVIVNHRLPDIDLGELVCYLRHHDDSMPIVMISAVMPPPMGPPEVDAVINKYSCAALLVPTLEVLLHGRMLKPVASDDSMAEAA